jgi:hypothetical protein
MKTRGFREAVILMSTIMAVVSLSMPAAQGRRFERVQPALFAAGEAFLNAWADYDGDGDVDQFVGFGGTGDRLYRNTDGQFEDVAADVGLAGSRRTLAAAWGDADADGDPDLLLGQAPVAGDAEQMSSVLTFYRNSDGVFRNDTAAVGLRVEKGAVRQSVWVDYDGDRDLDLFVAFRDRGNAMYRNDGGRFTDVAAAIGLADPRRTVGAVWFDHDEDGDLDVVTGNMDGDANGLFSQDAGKFSDVADAAGVAWGGRTANDKSNGTVRPCVADVDNDGHLDLFFANYGRNGLFLNRGRGRFANVTSAWGVDIDARYDSCAFADVDNDGDLDLYVNGTVTGGKQYDDYLFLNTGTTFDNITPVEIGSPKSDHGVQWIDFDRDGDMDLSLTGIEKDGLHWLLRNVMAASPKTLGVNVRVLDENGRATLAAAEVSIITRGRRQRPRLVDAGSGYNSQSDAPVHIVFREGEDMRVEVAARRGGTTLTYAVTLDNLERRRGRTYELRMPSGVIGRDQDDRVVPVHEEPRHRQVFETTGTRVLDIRIPPGDTTLFHTHSDPVLYVTMSTSRTRGQNLGGAWSGPAFSPDGATAGRAPARATSAARAPIVATDPPGRMMSTTSYAETPQTHRVNNVGDSLFRLIGITNSSAGDAGEEPSADFDINPEISNRWFRGYRVVLNKRESVEHRHANPVAVVLADGMAIVDAETSAGRVSVSADRPGFVTFVEGGARHTLRGGLTKNQVIEVEVRQPQPARPDLK